MKKILWVLTAVSMIFMFVGVASAGLNDGLLAYYPFNGNADDESGNGHDGTVSGATLTTDRFGNLDSAYNFDGNDYISVPDSNDFTFGSGPFTIAAWTQFSSFGADGGYYLMGHSEGPGNTDKWIFWLGNSSISFIVTQSGSDWIGLGSANFDLNTWYHVAIRRDANELSAFVDGSLIGTATINFAIPDPNAPFRIGTAEFDRPNRQFRGLIDDVRLYNRALSDTEIQELYNANPVCDIQMSQSVYTAGDTVTAQVFRIANPGTDPVSVEWKVWLGIPSVPPISVINIGANGSFVLPAGFDLDLGPIGLFPVTASTPLGSYEFSCRMLNPVTGELLAEDLNPFEVQ